MKLGRADRPAEYETAAGRTVVAYRVFATQRSGDGTLRLSREAYRARREIEERN
jgi:hypothetical protein